MCGNSSVSSPTPLPRPAPTSPGASGWAEGWATKTRGNPRQGWAGLGSLGWLAFGWLAEDWLGWLGFGWLRTGLVEGWAAKRVAAKRVRVAAKRVGGFVVGFRNGVQASRLPSATPPAVSIHLQLCSNGRPTPLSPLSPTMGRKNLRHWSSPCPRVCRTGFSPARPHLACRACACQCGCRGGGRWTRRG
jgi:hypothetical protein